MIAVLVGTRPELIKMAPVLRRLRSKKIRHIFIHSNQHYSQKMDQIIIKDLGLKRRDHHLLVGSGTHAVQTGKIMEGVEKILLKRKPKILLVHGDTNTTLGGALTAKKLHIPVAHIEAGLRSFDYRMPEEINRILTDRISDVLFAPTVEAKINLLKEGIDDSTIVVTGNTVVDALHQHLPLTKKSKVLSKLKVKKNKYILVTAHRPENVDQEHKLKTLLKILKHAASKLKKKLVWPVHPRTTKKLADFGLLLPTEFVTTPPLGYIDMLTLINNAGLVMTDSGGIQEEAYILKKPLVTLRDSTERPETLTANFIIDLDIRKFNQAMRAYKQNKPIWLDAFGDGKASHKIVETLKSYL